MNLQPPPPRQSAQRLQDLFPKVHGPKPSHFNDLTLEETPTNCESVPPPTEYRCTPLPNIPSTMNVDTAAVPHQEESDNSHQIEAFELTPKFIQDHINGDI